MRRADRAVAGLDNILAILDSCEILRIGLCLEDKPYIVPMNFAFETINGQVFIYLHCATEGKKLDIISRNSNVCFEADCSYKTIKAENACNWSAEFRSVIGEGTITAITDETQKIRALDILMKRYGFTGTPHYEPRVLSKVTALQISVASITGKQNQKT